MSDIRTFDVYEGAAGTNESGNEGPYCRADEVMPIVEKAWKEIANLKATIKQQAEKIATLETATTNALYYLADGDRLEAIQALQVARGYKTTAAKEVTEDE